MNFRLPLTIVTVLVLGGAGYYFINHSSHSQSTFSDQGHGHHETHRHSHDEETIKGPNNGRLLTDGDFTLELAIFERGGPPEFRAWFTKDGNLISPEEVELSVTLIRPGNKIDSFSFKPMGDFAIGDLEVSEPHSFSYEIIAMYQGYTHFWAFDAPEMQTTISESAAAAAGMKVTAAGPAMIPETLTVYGQVKFDSNKFAHAEPRFGGIILEAGKQIGESVSKGEIIAVVETNQTLMTMEVRAPMDGIIVERNAKVGETISDGTPIYSIADFSTVWVEFNIPKSDQGRVKTGLPAVIHADDGGSSIVGEITWISPVADVESQTVVARVVLANPEGRWRPGLFVKGEIELGKQSVAVAVVESGIQSLFDFTVVFSQHDDLYQARPLEIGRKGGGFVEVLKGLESGERYVVENSFLVKADIGKSGASHDH